MASAVIKATIIDQFVSFRFPTLFIEWKQSRDLIGGLADWLTVVEEDAGHVAMSGMTTS